MRLVQQSMLFFQEGNSDKVYEVDLCEVGDGLFVVNFRYGRRGANLREGTKTESPVDEAKARAVYAKLVASKEAKGYSAALAAPKNASDPAPISPARASASAPKSVVAETLLAQLARGPRGDRPLERVVWRVGELGLREAEPLLLEILALPDTPKNHIRTYSTIWALARCGGTASVAPLSVLRTHKKLSDATKALIAEVLRTIGDETLQSALRQEQLDAMRAPVREAVVAGDCDQLQASLRNPNSGDFPTQVLALYRHGSPCARPTILKALRTIPFQRDSFWAVRSIFKTAELRRDAQVFGLLAYRFETTRANNCGWYDRKEVFREPTRRYLRRRVARTLRHLGQDASPDFIPMAVGLLLPFTDEDASAPRRTVYEHWNYATHQTSRKTIHWGPFAGLWALNALLYSNSDRHAPDSGGKAWRATSADEPSGSKREEAFPELWDARPEALLHLLDESRCEPVHEMAAKALRANPKFCASLDIEALTVLVQAPYEITAQLGFDLIKDRPMDGPLVWLLTGCRLAEARDHAHRWLRAYSPAPFDDSALWATFILSPYDDNRSFVRTALAMVSCSDAFAQTVIGRVLAELKRADDDTGYYSEAAQILLAAFPKHARNLGEEVLRDLLEHDVLAVQEVGAELLLENDLLATKVPEDLLVALIDSGHPSIRTIGVKLLDKKPDSELSQYPELFIHLALHDLVDLRESCRPTIDRLAATYPSFGISVASALCEALLRKQPKGVPANVVVLLRGELQAHLPPADTSQTMRLLKAKSPHARELGALYLKRLQAEELTLFDIVSLASHEMLSIREAAWALCEKSVDRFRVTMPAIARLLDAKWQDSREFALRFIEAHFGPDDLGPTALIAICDSVRPEIQRFGQDLILKNFQDQDGHEYLAKLSEHPSTRLQLFVTNYLERYAAGDASKLEELSTYFLSVLSRVNKGGVAKRRVLRFLAAEGLKSPEAASIVARVLTRQSVTIAIQNKASIIEAMVAIAAKYPQADLPIRERALEARHAV